MPRFKDANWDLPSSPKGNIERLEGGSAHLAVLMDIRDELNRLNSLLYCSNFTGIPATLKAVEKNTKKKPKKK